MIKLVRFFRSWSGLTVKQMIPQPLQRMTTMA